MATYHRQNSHVNKKKVSVSYIIRDKDEHCHRSGINSLTYDPYLERLYTAGRDSVIRIWGFGKTSNQDSNSPLNTNPKNIPDDNNFPNHHHVEPANDDCYLQSMEHHTDWVNDITLCCNGRNLISVSNDTTIKVWNAHQGYCLSTLRSHKDYAKCLAAAKDREIVASAGFDRMIYIWDVQVLTMLTATKNTVTTKPLDGSKDSIYSLAMTNCGNLIASGSTERVIRLWDPRSRQKLLKLRGHTDNVKSLLFSDDGSLLLSASSDGTIRLWSIGQQRCISIIRVHDRGVWTLEADESFSTVYSGGKDGKIFMTNLKQSSNTALVCQERESILRILLVNRCYEKNQVRHGGNAKSLWVATADSSIKNWPVHDIEYHNEIMSSNRSGNLDPDYSKHSAPNVVIKGNPAVINYHVLNDKRHILTRESDNSIAIYDVLTARKLETLHRANDELESKEMFESEIKQRFRMVYVPNWFTVDLKIGLLCIHLDENEAFSAWVSAKDYGFLPQMDGQDPKINFGRLMLMALFEHWPATYEHYDNECKDAHRDTNSEHQSLEYAKNGGSSVRQKGNHDKIISNGLAQRVGNQYFSVATHTPIIISDGNQAVLKFQAHEASNDCDDSFIHIFSFVKSAPWISDIVLSKCQPKLTKVSNQPCENDSFFLQF